MLLVEALEEHVAMPAVLQRPCDEGRLIHQNRVDFHDLGLPAQGLPFQPEPILPLENRCQSGGEMGQHPVAPCQHSGANHILASDVKKSRRFYAGGQSKADQEKLFAWLQAMNFRVAELHLHHKTSINERLWVARL